MKYEGINDALFDDDLYDQLLERYSESQDFISTCDAKKPKQAKKPSDKEKPKPPAKPKAPAKPASRKGGEASKGPREKCPPQAESRLDEEYSETLDFARCQRADGTFYGTSGTCRSGTSVGPRERQALAKAAKAGNQKAKAALDVVDGKKTPEEAKKALKDGSYSPREAKGKTGVKAKMLKSKVTGENSAMAFDTKQLEDRMAALKEKKMPAAEKKKRVADLQRRIDQSKQNQEFLKRLEGNVPKGTKLEVDQTGIMMKSKTPSGDLVTSTFSPTMGYGFAVNNTLNSGTVDSRLGQLQVASQVRGQWDALVKSLPAGHIVETSAYTQDGKGASRQSAYERVGFSKAKPGRSIYSAKQADGSMKPVPATAKTSRAWTDQRGDANSIWFEEMDDNALDEAWRLIIFGADNEGDF